jgi:hypothetical protein
VREYFLEAANLCQLDVNSLLTGTGRLSRVLQKDNVQEQSTSRAISPSIEQDLARSTSLDAVPNGAASNGTAQNDSALNDATSGYQASPSAPSGDAWIENMLVANTTAPSAEISKKRARANRGTPVTAQHHTGSFVTMTTPLSNQAGSATPDTDGRYTLQHPASLHEVMQRPEVRTPSLPLLSVPNQERLGYQIEGMQHFEHQVQPNVDPERQQDMACQTAIFSPSTNEWIRTAPYEANERLCRPGSTDLPGLHVQAPVPMAQGIGWDGTSLNVQHDSQYWFTYFPPGMYN